MAVEFNGTNVSGAVAIPNTGAWSTFQTVTINNVSLTGGQKIMRIVFNTGGVNYNYVNIASSTARLFSIEEDANILNTLEVYPNPAEDATYISGKSGVCSSVQIQVINTMGVEVIHKEVSCVNGQFEYSLDLANHPKGIYTIKASFGENTLIKKVVKN
jgi:hypothetical protein